MAVTASRYAAGTDVPTDRSRAEIEKTLRRYGATAFAYAWTANQSVIGFEADGRHVRLAIPMPDPADREFTVTPTGKDRSAVAAADMYERAVRQRWRVLALVVKAKLEAVEAGLVSFETEFLAYLVLPGGATVGETVRDRVAEAYQSGRVPALLPDYQRAIESGGRP